MYILYAFLDDEFPAQHHGVYVAQFSQQGFQFVGGEQSYALQHGDVGHGAQYVMLRQVEVEFAVASHGETLYLGIYLKILFPEFHLYFMVGAVNSLINVCSHALSVVGEGMAAVQ